jgi:O-acetylhomoserine/O-acetylserine sulfhydrylase-like pyridoxal-dependent enzyme
MSLRVRAQSCSALRLATFFQSHPRVASVIYPGLQVSHVVRAQTRHFCESIV